MDMKYTLPRASLVERAYELARSGCCNDVCDVHDRLMLEGYRLSEYFKRPSMNKDLLRVCREARDERPPRTRMTEVLRRWFMTGFMPDVAFGDAGRR